MKNLESNQLSNKCIRISSTWKKLWSMFTAKRLLLCCLCLAILVFSALYHMGHLRIDVQYISISSDRSSLDVVLLEEPRWYFLCADVNSTDSRPCLCYYDSVDVPETFSVPKTASIRDKQLVRALHGRCAMTVNAAGRLGNLMSEYSVLYALTRINRRPAFMLPAMAKVLHKYFNVTMPIISEQLANMKGVWTGLQLHYWMEDSYTYFDQTFITITGYPYSWTYFHHLRDDILREFAFSDKVLNAVQEKLSGVSSGRKSVTYVGVHVRRGDYVELMKTVRRQGTVADAGFFRQATGYFRSKHPDSIFVVASDDLKWCKKNIDNSKKDVYYVGNENTRDPILDMAVLASCNHSIITIGTFGFWTAYLAGGETVHLTNYSNPNASWHEVLQYDKLYLPDWIPIAADMSSVTPVTV